MSHFLLFLIALASLAQETKLSLLACTHHLGLLIEEVNSDCCLNPVSGQMSPRSLDSAFQMLSFTQWMREREGMLMLP